MSKITDKQKDITPVSGLGIDKPRRDGSRPGTRREDEPVIIPLSFEQALGGLLAAGPHPADETELAEDIEAAPPKRQRKSKVSEAAEG